MATCEPEVPLEQLGGIALYLEQLLRDIHGIRDQVSIDAVRRACVRKSDPLPGVRVLGRWRASPSRVRTWFLRQAPAQLDLFSDSQ